MSNTADIKHRPVRTIRLPADQIARILDEMDLAPTGWHGARRDSRYRYRLHEIVVLMQQPGLSAPMAFIVPTRNISARGLAFLHGGFVHPGTICVVQLVTTRGGQQNVVGVVRRCRYVQSNVHEVAVQFKNAVDPAVFCHDAVSLRVLLAEDDPSLVRLSKLHLGRLNCVVDHAPDGQAALDMATHGTFDLILLDMDLPVLDGYSVARELRTLGYTGIIVAGTGSDADDERKRSLEAGCDRHMVKPFGYDQLAEVTASLQSEPLFSSFHDDTTMTDVIADFVGALAGKIRAIEQALAAQDTAALRSLTTDLKVAGRGYGFEEITLVASKVEKSLRDGEPLDTVAPSVRALIRLCAQARAAPKPKPVVVVPIAGTSVGNAKPASHAVEPVQPPAHEAAPDPVESIPLTSPTQPPPASGVPLNDTPP